MIAAGNGTFTRMAASSPGGGVEVFVMRCGGQYFVYAVNTTSSTVLNKVISFTVSSDNTFSAQYFNPETLVYQGLGAITSSSKNVQIPNVTFAGRESKIFILSHDDDKIGFRLPYNGASHVIPGVIQVEDFDTGGEGISFHDFEPTNTGGAYRTTEGVDIISHNMNEHSLSNVVKGEWLEYMVDVQKRATYKIKVKAASLQAGKKISLTLDDESIATNIHVPSTSTLTNWTQISINSPILESGLQRLRLHCTSSDFSIDEIEFEVLNIAPSLTMVSPLQNAVITLPAHVEFQADANDEDGNISRVEFYNGATKLSEDTEAPFEFSWNAPAGQHNVTAKAVDENGLFTEKTISIKVNPSMIQEPFSGTPISLPGKVEGEDLDKGASGVAFSDKTAGNIKGEYRTDTEADIEVCSDTGGGYNLADIQSGEWVEYTVGVAEAGKYDFNFRVATQMASQKFKILVNNTSAGTIIVPNTGGWQTWATVSLSQVDLPSGDIVIRLVFDTEFFNLNFFAAEKSIVSDVEDDLNRNAVIHPNPSTKDFTLTIKAPFQRISILNMQGHEVSTLSNQRDLVFGSQLAAGLYIIKIYYADGHYDYLRTVKQ
jgi:hypothetical protein